MMLTCLKTRFAWLVVLALLLLLSVSVVAAQDATEEPGAFIALIPEPSADSSSLVMPTQTSGLIAVPMLPDAADVLQVPGMTSYTTASGLEDTLAFYQEQVTSLGGQADPPLLTASSGALFGFTLDGQPYLIVITTDLAGAIIDLYQLQDAEILGITAEVPDERGTLPEPTEVGSASGACEPGTSSVPITPDANSIQEMGGMGLSYMTSMSPAEVTAFYEEQLAALGGQITSPVPATDFMAMLNVEQNDLSYSIMIAPMGTTTNVTISSLTMQANITACTPESSTAAPATAATDVPADTEPESGGCPRGMLPLMPDAANIMDVAAMGAITYTTAATVAEVVAFYEDQFGALGAMSVPQMPATDSMAAPAFMLENVPIILTITAVGDGSTSVSISIMGGSPFRGAAPCT